ncbi:MAG: aminopeptidase, partial [Gammaproteobacteria bacterium]
AKGHLLIEDLPGVGILFHELAHQKIYIDDDSSFNEAFATAVEQEGVKRWFVYKHQYDKLAEFKQHLTRKNEFNSLLLQYRNVLKTLYKSKSNKKEILLEKKRVFNKLKQDYALLKLKWNGYTGYDKWMNQELNNAHLAIISTYNDLVPLFSKKINESHNISIFYEYIVNLSKYDIKKRKKLLNY